MNKLLCIVGPTGTGKTKRAIEESLKKPSILVSADSRQVYRGMDIVTGKDHPQNSQIYGIDIVDPDQSISVAVWYDSVMPHINQAWNEGKQVIVVGGTGLYVKALTSGIATMQVGVNQSLRDKLETISITQLQAKLNELDHAKFDSMNHSDQNNPRRLIRAIEIAHTPHLPSTSYHPPATKIIGLHYYHDSNYSSNIRTRVLSRLKAGAIQETESLLNKYGSDVQSMSAIGYTSILKFLDNQLDQSEMVDHWVKGEWAYAKRQLTWFRKVKSIKWYDVGTIGA